MSRRTPCRKLFLAALAAIVSLETSCLVAVAPAKHAYKGRTDQVLRKVDFAFLRAGVTTRDEVVQRLDWVTPGVSLERLFVGRFVDSRWYMAYLGDSSTVVPAAAGRVWSGKNLVVEFDESGRVVRYAIIPDDKFPAAMAAALQRTQATTALPETLAAGRYHGYSDSEMDLGTLHLRASEIEFRDSNTGQAITVSKSDIKNVVIVGAGEADAVPTAVSFEIDARDRRRQLEGPFLLRLEYADFISLLLALH